MQRDEVPSPRPWQPLKGPSWQNHRFRGKHSLLLLILVQQPQWLCTWWGETGTALAEMALGGGSVVTWAPTDICPVLLSGGWMPRKAHTGDSSENHPLAAGCGCPSPLLSQLSHRLWTPPSFPANSVSHCPPSEDTCLFPPDVCALLPLFEHILFCASTTQNIRDALSLPNSCLSMHGKKPTSPSRFQH